MRLAGASPDRASVDCASVDWASVDVTTPRAPGRLPGISMAGFRQRSPERVDIAMVAHPSVTLLIDLSDGEGLVCDSGGRHSRGSVAVGLLPGEVRTGGRVGSCLQIRLQPVVAAAVIGASAELSGTVAAFGEVWGAGAGRFEDRLRAARSWEERFAIATAVIGRRLGDARTVDGEVTRTWRRTLATRGRLRVDGLAGEVGWSRQRLWSRFRSQLGITPKQAARLVRFDHAAHLLTAGHAPGRAAAEAGYADQSHLHREARAFTGLTPAAVAAAPWLAIDGVAWPLSSCG